MKGFDITSVSACRWVMRSVGRVCAVMLLSLTAQAQSLTLVELNCENLFDYRDDSLKQDEEYLPEAIRHWTRKRYWRKLNNIAQELLSTSDNIPDLIALCEVEGDTVMNDLTKRSLLRNAGYEYVMTNSPDLRGIDVALAYSPYAFAPVSSYPIRVKPVKDMRPTRDILYVSGRTVTGDTLHVFVVHAPSRYGGERYSRPFRMAVADRLCQSVDSIQMTAPEASILIAGDFNDEHDGAVIQHLCRHRLNLLTKGARGQNGVGGSYRYKGQWGSIDHVLGSLSISSKVDTAYIHSPRFLLEEEKLYGGYRPRRTYIGMKHQDGYSDHLPVVVRLHL